MGSILLILFVISLPVFYVLGLLKFISLITGDKKKVRDENIFYERASYLREAIKTLIIEVKNSPNKKVFELLSDYKKEYTELSKSVQGGEEQVSQAQSADIRKRNQGLMSQDVGSLWTNWYSENSINLLLYLGAFLIIAASAIFIGFQWETIPGVIKSLLLTFVAAAFFTAGFYFYNLPKIRNAGSVFIAIGALLIPLLGVAWYSFVLKDAGLTAAGVWIVTSLIVLTIYTFFAVYLKNNFYSYASSLSVISLLLSATNILNLDTNYYILASILGCFILLVASVLTKDTSEGNALTEPLAISSSLIMPATLIYGFVVAAGDSKLVSVEATLSVFLAGCYYLLSYVLTKETWKLAIAQILMPIAITLFFLWSRGGIEMMFYALLTCSAFYLLLAFLFRRDDLNEESDINIVVGMALSVIIFAFSIFYKEITPINKVLFSFIPALFGAFVIYIRKDYSLIGFSAVFLGITVWVFNRELLSLESQTFLVVSYLGLGIVSFLFSAINKGREDILNILLGCSVLYFLLAIIFSFSSPIHLFAALMTASLILIIAAFQLQRPLLISFFGVFLFASLFPLFIYLNFELYNLPIVLISISFLLWGISFTSLHVEYREKFREVALGSAIIIPLVSFVYSQVQSYSQTASLILISSAYSSTILFALDIYFKKTANMAYITSAVGMGTLLWQLRYFNLSEAHFYTIPLGIYFLILAYTRKIKHDEENENALNMLGAAFLIIPATVLSLGEEAFRYSLILGLIGIILLPLGISFSNKIFRYGGIFAIVFAIIPQTYGYIASLPRWLVVGILGLIFLTVAIYLLLRRKD